MKIFFSQKQYKTLLKVVETATWIAGVGTDYGAQSDDFKIFCNEAHEIAEHLKSFAKEMNASKLIDEESEEFNNMLDIVSNVMEEYENVVFYDNLIHKLIIRDCVKKYGKNYYKFSPEERMVKHLEFSKKYESAISEYGIDKIILSD